jgi:glycine betaine/proline transport system permease protein
MNWLHDMPQMSRADMLALRQTLDGAYRNFSRQYGDTIEAFFDPLLRLLIYFENLLLTSPWWAVLGAIVGIVYLSTRSWKLSVSVWIAFMLIGYFGMWDDTMKTMSIILVCTIIAVGLGIPIGILMAASNRARTIITPILDVMQTLPAFVYLIPVVMLLGIGRIPGVIAVVIYAIPPVIRLTNLGIRLVDKEVLEAAAAYGVNPLQRLFGVQLPLAMPNIMAGINQTIMMALAMVVIASMIGVQGLGQPVLRSITNQHFTLGLLNGLAIVVLAIIFDRVSQAYARRAQRQMGMQDT